MYDNMNFINILNIQLKVYSFQQSNFSLINLL